MHDLQSREQRPVLLHVARSAKCGWVEKARSQRLWSIWLILKTCAMKYNAH